MDLVESSCISKEKESDIVFEKNEDVPLLPANEEVMQDKIGNLNEQIRTMKVS